MNYSRTLCGCFIFLFIIACDTQTQITPVKKIAEIEIRSIETLIKVSAVSQQSRPLLNLSIDDISLENRKNNNDMFISDYHRTEKNSALFNELSRKQPENSLILSGELLTDKNIDETNDFLKSVNGIQINVQGSFN